MKRLESTTLSPIFASFRTTLEGLATVRAFSAERPFISRMMQNLDISTKCNWAYWMMNRWCLFVFDTIGAVTILVVMVIVIAFAGASVPNAAFGTRSGISSGFEGLVIVTAMGFTNSVYWACRFLTQLELDLKFVVPH